MQYKLQFGKKAKHTHWGRKGLARGMYSGGFTYWIYGIKGLFNLKKLECWGQFRNMKITEN